MEPPIFDTGLDGKPLKPVLKGELAVRFKFPPFTVLDARAGEWQSRKAAWVRLGIRSELGRGANVLGHSPQSGNWDFYRAKKELEEAEGTELTTEEATRILAERGEIKQLSSGAGRGDNLLGFSASLDDRMKNRGDWSGAEAARVRAMKAAQPGGGGGPNSAYARGAGAARAYNIGMKADKENNWSVEDNQGSGTSIFDPVLCELLYSWFAPPGGQVVDPFAGGSVRGIVAAALGRPYWGCDLSEAQIAANRAQVGILPPRAPVPRWVNGDAAERVPRAPDADFVIACPPYFDLEVYSDDPADLSTMGWDAFRRAYAEIIAACAERLKPDRFAAFVVGDTRDGDGRYRNLPGCTVDCFERAGMELYNEAVLVTAVGSLPVRTQTQFVMSRKMGKTHQNVLVFVKGDPWRAVDAVTGMSTEERRQALKDEREARKKNVVGFRDEPPGGK